MKKVPKADCCRNFAIWQVIPASRSPTYPFFWYTSGSFQPPDGSFRIVTAGNCDFASARLMLWAMDLTAAALPAEPASRPHRAHNPNVSYYVPVNPLFIRSCGENPSQVPKNTMGAGEGVSPLSRLGNPTGKRVRFLQPGSQLRATLLGANLGTRRSAMPQARRADRA